MMGFNYYSGKHYLVLTVENGSDFVNQLTKL